MGWGSDGSVEDAMCVVRSMGPLRRLRKLRESAMAPKGMRGNGQETVANTCYILITHQTLFYFSSETSVM